MRAAKPPSFEEQQEMLGDNLSFAASEAYKLLRTNIIFSLPDEQKCRVIGVTSSMRGEGKSTTTINLAYSLAQAGKQVLIYQFLKDNSSSERKVLDTIPGITCIKGPDKVKFIRNMTQEEKEENRRQNDQKLEDIIKIAGEYDVLILDEALYAIGREQLSEELLIRYLKERPWWQEVILTGRDPSREMRALADYCTHIQKEKHPFDQGLCSRKGIEY